MLRFEKWITSLGIDKSNIDKAKILGEIVGEVYMQGLAVGTDLTDADILSMTEAEFTGQQIGKLMSWYLEELPESS